MGKSARVLGWDFGRTAAEMNTLLKDYGYLHGGPGAYGLTEKGEKFGAEQYHDNGYGGRAARSWETRTWNDDLADALRADMAAYPDGMPSPVEDSAPASAEQSFEAAATADTAGPGKWNLNSKKVKVAAGVAATVTVVVVVAPHVKPFWNDKVKPKVRRMRQKFSKREGVEVDAAPAETGEPDSMPSVD